MITREEKTITWGFAMILLILLIWEVAWCRVQLNNSMFRTTVIESQMLDMREDVTNSVVKVEKVADELMEKVELYKEPE